MSASAQQSQDHDQTETEQPHHSIRSLLARRWWLVVLCATAGLAVALFSVAREAPLYRSQLNLTSTRPGTSDLSAERDIALSRDFTDSVEATLLTAAHPATLPRQDLVHRSSPGIPYAQVLLDTAARTKIALAPGSLQFVCESADATIAASWCNALAANLLERVKLLQTPHQRAASQRLLEAQTLLNRQLAALKSQAGNLPGIDAIPATSERLQSLEQAILETRKLELLEAEAGDSAAYTAAQHREDLLHLSFDGELEHATSEQRAAAQATLLRREIDSSTQSSDRLALQIDHTASESTSLRITQPAQAATSPLSRHLLLKVLVCTCFGELCGLILVFFFPRKPVFLRKVSMRSSAAEAVAAPYDRFQILAYSLLLDDWGKGFRRYAITSPHPGAGKTSIAANLGIALSRTDLRVLLVDANLQHPALHTHFHLPNDLGLGNLLSEPFAEEPIKTTQPTTHAGLSILSAGRAEDSPDALLLSPAFPEILARLAAGFDMIVIDLPSLESPAAFLVAAQCQGTLVIAPKGEEDSEDIRVATHRLQESNIRVCGSNTNQLSHAA